MRICLLACLLFLSACVSTTPTGYGTEAQMKQRAEQPHVPSPGYRHVDYVLVEKSKNKMTLFKEGEVVRQYHVSLGKNPVGHKTQEGDLRTPEGRYNLMFKNPDSKFYKSIMIDYPNERDRALASRRGVDPGGEIVIHGQPNTHFAPYEGVVNAFNWTDGCIAVTNPEMGEIWRLVDVDTPIEIKP